MHRLSKSHRLVLPLLFLLLLVLPGCQFLQNEFFYLDRPPLPPPEAGPATLRPW